jgi:hypothetical protein
LEEGEKCLPMHYLRNMGFDFRYFTHVGKHEYGRVIYCYDQGYILLGKDVVIRKEISRCNSVCQDLG